jgi:hypothetical protein
METSLMRDMTKDFTKEERDSLDSWIEHNVGPLEDLTKIIKDLGSTESSSESFADAINYLFSADGTKEFKECLEKSSQTS